MLAEPGVQEVVLVEGDVKVRRRAGGSLGRRRREGATERKREQDRQRMMLKGLAALKGAMQKVIEPVTEVARSLAATQASLREEVPRVGSLL